MNFLSPEEVQSVQSMIDCLPPGIYEVSEIFGVTWAQMPNRYCYGRRFRQSVMRGHLVHIHYHDRTETNHRRYAITHANTERLRADT
jgi:hypothetical protein